MALTTTTPVLQTSVTALDALWALYLSQPKKVQRAFRLLIEGEKKSAVVAQWEQDLKEIRTLKENWDGEGAPKINVKAVQNARRLMKTAAKLSAKLRLYPTRLGAVMVAFETNKGRVKGEIGDAEFSYFVKRPGQPTEHHSFEPLNSETMLRFTENVESIL